MSQPHNGQIHQNVPLSNVSLAYLPDLSRMFVGHQVFPMLPVQKQSDEYYIYNKGDWFRDEAKPRAPGTPAARSGYNLSTGSYRCQVYALATQVPDQDRANADAALDLDADAARFVTMKAMLRHEIDWFSKFFTTSVWTGSTSGSDIAPSTKWNASNSTPIADISAQMDSILEKTGFLPNTLTLSRKAWTAIKTNADFLNRVSGGASNVDPAKVTPQLLAQVLEISRVLIAGGVKNTAAEGATASMAFIDGGEGALLTHSAEAPGLRVATAGYTFVWTGYPGANAAGIAISSYREDQTKSDVVEAESAFDNKVVATDLGVFFSDVLT